MQQFSRFSSLTVCCYKQTHCIVLNGTTGLGKTAYSKPHIFVLFLQNFPFLFSSSNFSFTYDHLEGNLTNKI